MALCAAVASKLADTFMETRPGWWKVLRFGLSTFFVIILVALLWSKIADRRSRQAGTSGRGPD